VKSRSWGRVAVSLRKRTFSSKHSPLTVSLRTSLGRFGDLRLDMARRPVAEPRFVLDLKLGRRVDGLERIPLFFLSTKTAFSATFPPFAPQLLLSSCP